VGAELQAYLDPTQWPKYYGLDYVPDPDLLKTKKDRRKKKRLRGAMDASNRYGEDMYGLETLMRHRDRSVASNATKPVTPLPLIINIRRQRN
jgi:hypothetical protein